VFGGMLAAAIVGIFFVPGFYAIFQSMRERVKGVDDKASAPTSVSRMAALERADGLRQFTSISTFSPWHADIELRSNAKPCEKFRVRIARSRAR
jgi:hypothetical protein